jgi:two-component SAPR family response regulator
MPARKKVEELAKIISKGSFLAGANYEWIDNFKLETANEIIDAYLLYANSINIADDAEFLIEVANYIFYFDPVNEEAMQIKCKALVHLGKRSLAKYAFEHFCHEYKAIYKENFDKDFQSIIG